jgi:phosphoribosylaminoimidazole-succinocarboxamide synthase
MEFLTSGKVKDIYTINDKNILFRFSNRVSAYDVKFNQDIPKKGHVLCTFAEFWFNNLPVQNHFVEKISNTEIIVKKMNMLPIECVVRGYYYGSLVNRVNDGQIILDDNMPKTLAAKLPEPIFDPTTKSDTHDTPITKQDAIEQNLVSSAEYDFLAETSTDIYIKMSHIIDKAGFILADLKLEFGRYPDDKSGEIILGDSIGLDECRLWPKDGYTLGKTQQSYDKQILRDWLSENGYKEQFDKQRDAGMEPTAPQIPPHIIQKMTERYVTACKRITGESI